MDGRMQGSTRPGPVDTSPSAQLCGWEGRVSRRAGLLLSSGVNRPRPSPIAGIAGCGIRAPAQGSVQALTSGMGRRQSLARVARA